MSSLQIGLKKSYGSDERPQISIRVSNTGNEEIRIPLLRLQQTVILTLYSVGPQNAWSWISENIPAFKKTPNAARGSSVLRSGTYADLQVPPSMFDFIMSSPGKYRLQFDLVSSQDNHSLDRGTWEGGVFPPGVEFEVR